MMRAGGDLLRPSLTILACVGLVACTATRISYNVVRAEEALLAAEAAGAPESAVYEYTMARNALDKAKDEVSQSQYKVASALALRSVLWSQRAQTFVEEQERSARDKADLQDAEDDQ